MSYYQQICLKAAVKAFCFRPDDASTQIKQLAAVKSLVLIPYSCDVITQCERPCSLGDLGLIHFLFCTQLYKLTLSK